MMHRKEDSNFEPNWVVNSDQRSPWETNRGKCSHIPNQLCIIRVQNSESVVNFNLDWVSGIIENSRRRCWSVVKEYVLHVIRISLILCRRFQSKEKAWGDVWVIRPEWAAGIRCAVCWPLQLRRTALFASVLGARAPASSHAITTRLSRPDTSNNRVAATAAKTASARCACPWTSLTRPRPRLQEPYVCGARPRRHANASGVHKGAATTGRATQPGNRNIELWRRVDGARWSTAQLP